MLKPINMLKIDRQHLEAEFARMAEGQKIVIPRHLFDGAYPCGWPSIYNTHREAFLSSKVGSAWGCWTCELNLRGDNYIIGRHRGNEHKRVYCDPDREHLFDRLPSGELVPKDR